MSIHPDVHKMIAAITEYDETQGVVPDAAGNVAGVNYTAILVAAGQRAQMMFENCGPLRKTLTPAQTDEVQQLMRAMWMDGFSASAAYSRMHGNTTAET